MILYFNRYDNGEIMTIAEEPLDGTVAIETPADWTQYGTAKYIIVNNQLVARDGWVDPVIEPEVPVEPETPADPE